MSTKFENVNIIETLQKIMLHNTQSFQWDFENDIKRLQKAAEDKQGCRYFLWMTHSNGTWCFEERDVYIRDTDAFNNWIRYSYKNENVKAFAVQIDCYTGMEVEGNIFELDYKSHIEDVRRNILDAQSVEVVFKHPDSSNGYVRIFEINEYYYIGKSYGEAEKLHYMVSDENKLETILNHARHVRIQESIGGNCNVDEYIAAMVKTHFHSYGYTRDDMVFTSYKDAFDALRNKLPVYILSRDNSCEPVINADEIVYHMGDKGIFGMTPEDKHLLGYLMAPTEKRVELFSQVELQQIYTFALAAGQSGEYDESMMKTVETIVNKLDKVLPTLPETAENVRELDKEMEV